MGDKSGISWTDATWNPVLGCTKVSAGCEHCYAIRVANRNQHYPQMAEAYGGLTRKFPDGSLNWTGAVRALDERLAIPIHWKRPRHIFVNSMSDLFHESVPDPFILQVWLTMALASQHRFQILTKRPERMREFVNGLQHVGAGGIGQGDHRLFAPELWPLPNVWLGVSTEDQAAAEPRVLELLQTAAAVHFISYEPALGPLALRKLAIAPGSGGSGGIWLDALTGAIDTAHGPLHQVAPLDWVICGGESGPHYRPMDLDWARAVRDDCVAADVAFWFKQESGPRSGLHPTLDGVEWHQWPRGAEPAATAAAVPA